MLGFSGKIPLVWKNLLHQKVRTFMGIAGIAFAVILIFLQLGFLGSAEAGAAIVYHQLDFDLVVLSREYVRIDQAGLFPAERLPRIRAHPDIDQVVPFYIAPYFWHKDRGTPVTGARLNKRTILVLAFPPDRQAFVQREIVEQTAELKQVGNVLFDRHSSGEFEVPAQMTAALRAQTYWLGQQPVHVAGQFTLGAGLVANGMVVISEETYGRLTGHSVPPLVNMGLIKLRSGASPDRVAEELNRWLKVSTPDVRVWTRAVIEKKEVDHWVKSMPIGIIFQAGVFVAVLVGIVFVYQVISSDISSRLKEFATLKAIGKSDLYLSGTILYQAILLALFGFFPGMVVSFGLYWLAGSVANIPIGFHGEGVLVVLVRCLAVLLITTGLCTMSALLALGKLKAADPADLF